MRRAIPLQRNVIFFSDTICAYWAENEHWARWFAYDGSDSERPLYTVKVTFRRAA